MIKALIICSTGGSVMRTFESTSQVAGTRARVTGRRRAITGETIGVVGAGGLDLAAARIRAQRRRPGPSGAHLPRSRRNPARRRQAPPGRHPRAVRPEPPLRSHPRRRAIDIDGGAGSLLTYSGIGRRELPNSTVWPDGDVQSLSRDGSFVARHISVSRTGVAVQINAFNFPVWGMLEKFVRVPRRRPDDRQAGHAHGLHR